MNAARQVRHGQSEASERSRRTVPAASHAPKHPAFAYLAPPVLARPSASVQRKCGACTAEDDVVAASGPQHRRLVPTSDPAELQADDIGARIGADLAGVAVSPGPLSPRAQRAAERHLGISLAGTRIADDHRGHRRAVDERALAVTEGSEISFRSGHLTTATHAGRSLLGHELTHVAQQRSARSARTQKFDPLGAIVSVGKAGLNVAGDALDTGVNVAGDALSTGWNVAGDVATGDFSGAVSDLQSGASSALGHVKSGAASASTDAMTGVAGATNALLGDFGVHASVSGTGLAVAVDDIQLFDTIDVPLIDGSEWSQFIPIVGGAIPVGPVVLGGALGFMVRVKPQLMGSLGPGWIRNVSVVFDPLSLTATATGQLYIAGAIGPRVSLSGAAAALGGIAIPDPPIMLIAGVEGGLRGTGRGSALGALQITASGGFTGGKFSLDLDNRLKFGVHLMGTVDAYVAATLYNKIICEYVWRLLNWSGGPAWELSVPISMKGFSRPKLGKIGFGSIPIGTIENGIKEPPVGGRCLPWSEVKKLLCEVGVLPPEYCKDKDKAKAKDKDDDDDDDDDDDGSGSLAAKKQVKASGRCKCNGEASCGGGGIWEFTFKTQKDCKKAQKDAEKCCNSNDFRQNQCRTPCTIHHTRPTCPDEKNDAPECPGRRINATALPSGANDDCSEDAMMKKIGSRSVGAVVSGSSLGDKVSGKKVKSGQEIGNSKKLVCKYASQACNGSAFPAIDVYPGKRFGVIDEGHHRFLASRLTNIAVGESGNHRPIDYDPKKTEYDPHWEWNECEWDP